MSPKSKREKRAPMRFQPWKEGDAHSPMSVRRQKSKQKAEQKKFREMRKEINKAKQEIIDGETTFSFLLENYQ